VIDVALCLAGVLALAAGITAEATGTIPATGLALVLGTCVAMYLWFLAIARRHNEPSQRRMR
jgi:drug/metabolite transporter (DMT)-like permease